MTDSAEPKQPLGVGGIIGETFSLFFANILTAGGIAMIPVAVVTLVSVLIFGLEMAAGADFDPATLGDGFVGGFGFVMILQMIAYSVATAMLVSFAYDRKLGRKVRFGAYLSGVAKQILPLVVLGIVFYLCFVIGLALLILPGLWIMAVWAAWAPVVVIENAGFGALGRSSALTKDYRWPIIGLLVITFILMFLLSFVLAFIVGLLITIGGGLIISVLLNLVVSAVTFAFGSMMMALLYARLREIKEGVSVEHLADVFA
ncbi:MAG: hypothetical protein AAF401_00860 [Pseudomonadota bacterium]